MVHNKIAIVDLETTGPNYETNDKIIQIGAIFIEKGKITQRYNMLINPEIEIPTQIQHLTGITQDMVSNAPTIDSVIQLWYERLKDCFFVAHNINFDLNFLKYTFKKFDLKFEPYFIDTVVLSKILFPQAKGFNLLDLSEYFNIEFKNSHNALADAEITTIILNNLAQKCNQLDIETRESVKRFLFYLPGNYCIFFDNPAKFFIEEISNNINIQKTIYTNAQIDSIYIDKIEYILENHSHLVIENPYIPFTQSWGIEILKNKIKDNEPIIFLTNDKEKLLLIQEYIENYVNGSSIICEGYNEYLHLPKFIQMVDEYNCNVINQQEIIKICACFVWLESTDSGLYLEINKELRINDLLDKYISNEKNDYRHIFYEQMIKDKESSKLILTTNNQFIKFMKKNRTIDIKKNIICDNYQQFVEALKYSYIQTINMSKYLSYINKLKEDLQDDEYTVSCIKDINIILKQIIKIISILESFIKEKDSLNSKLQENMTVYLPKNTNVFNLLFCEIEFLYECSSRLYSIFIKENISYINLEEYKYHLNQLCFFLKKTISDEDNFIINYTKFNNYYYNFSIIRSNDLESFKFFELLMKYNNVIFISEGNYFLDSIKSTKSIFKYERTPFLFLNDKINIKVPLEYCGNNTKDQYKLLMEYLINNVQNKKIMIMTSNVNECDIIYDTLVNEEKISQQYSIYAQKVSGSLNKIFRRFKETEYSIVIVSEFALLKHKLFVDKMKLSLIILDLPFQSPENPIVLSQSSKYINDFDIFEQILLPHMINDFKVLLTYLNEFYILDDVVLLDDRVYTKNYSNKFRNEVKFLVEFYIDFE